MVGWFWTRKGKAYINEGKCDGEDIHSTNTAIAMKSLILMSVIVLVASVPDGYNLSGPRGGSFTHGTLSASRGTISQGASSGIATFQGTTSGSTAGQGTSSGASFSRGTASGAAVSRGTSSGTTSGFGATRQGPCGGGQVRHVDGRCVTPRVNRRVFVYDVPSSVQTSGPVNIPEPRVETNIVLIRSPEGGLGAQPVVIPPPRQNNVVYVLNKQSSAGPGVIEVPSSGPTTPEVYFVNYAEGENPTLPGGVDLQSALQAASQGAAQTVGSAGQAVSSSGQTVASTGHSGSSVGQAFGSGVSSGSFGGQVGGLRGLSGSLVGQAIGSSGHAGSSGGQVSVGQTSSGGGQSFARRPPGLYTQP
ncbi:secreted protein C-like [Penaeus monodon]|uniref:secreted protein C-like n=1 Tax=Penaeus monodon TaxID=6687 RepID=UPI0018A78436|nr:secreted protein C-like [Penaeus monodon]